MIDLNLPKYSRAGDSFHYRWGARRCLEMLHPNSNIEMIKIEGSEEYKLKGEFLIDVAEYSQGKDKNKRDVIYYQLKHSTKRVNKNFTFTELKKTITGFADRFNDIRNDKNSAISSLTFAIVTNREISKRFKKTIIKFSKGRKPTNSTDYSFLKSIDLKGRNLIAFCKSLKLYDGEGNYNEQKYELHSQISNLIGVTSDTSLLNHIISLVKECALPENDGKIVKEDILKRFGVTSEKELFPAITQSQNIQNLVKREQLKDLSESLFSDNKVKVIHASGGIGKSVLARQLINQLPPKSIGIIYDCFDSGRYRNISHSRHRYKDGLIQII
ncbi:ATP-binding protein, partial [Gracilimonas sp. BCB1]